MGRHVCADAGIGGDSSSFGQSRASGMKTADEDALVSRTGLHRRHSKLLHTASAKSSRRWSLPWLGIGRNT
jgi:hypothetical protein